MFLLYSTEKKLDILRVCKRVCLYSVCVRVYILARCCRVDMIAVAGRIYSVHRIPLLSTSDTVPSLIKVYSVKLCAM